MHGKKLYFLGIKGSGVSALAGLCHDNGYEVVGSDVPNWLFSQVKLEERGIEILAFDSKNIENHLDYTFICGDAFNETNNEEMKYIKEKNINFMRYHDFVGIITKQISSVGIAGCHGKTTTTNIFALGLEGLMQTQYIIGDGRGKGNKDAEVLLVEADEYRNHFFSYNFDYTVVTNIDFDHPDFFNSIDDMCFTFETFINNTSKKAICWGEDKYIKDLDIKDKDKIITYGFENNNDFVVNIIKSDSNGSTFNVEHQGKVIVQTSLPLFGKHMILNATSLVVYGYLMKLDLNILMDNLKNYQTPQRRFNISEVGERIIIDDYAHHPSEINTVLDSIKQKYEGTGKEIIAVHMPFTYSRTRSLFDGFVDSLKGWDKAYITPIFASPRETEVTIHEDELINAIDGAELITKETIDILDKHENAVFAFMSCGDIRAYVDIYKKHLNDK